MFRILPKNNYFCISLRQKRNMSDILNILCKLKIFTTQELTQALDGKVKSVASLLQGINKKDGLYKFAEIPTV